LKSLRDRGAFTERWQHRRNPPTDRLLIRGSTRFGLAPPAAKNNFASLLRFRGDGSTVRTPRDVREDFSKSNIRVHVMSTPSHIAGYRKHAQPMRGAEPFVPCACDRGNTID
jgi:hypothetical protein